MTAAIEEHADGCRVWFAGADALRGILVNSLQEKPEFLSLVRSFGARVVSFVDGRAYIVSRDCAQEFVVAAEKLAVAYLPEAMR